MGYILGLDVFACTNHTYHIPVHMQACVGCYKVGVGGFPAKEMVASNHMRREGESSGTRPGLGGNQQHMNLI